jgi:hypothetical protein
MRGLHIPNSYEYFDFAPVPNMTPRSHPHLAMQTPRTLSTADLLALYVECSPWCESETTEIMRQEMARRGVTPPASRLNPALEK